MNRRELLAALPAALATLSSVSGAVRNLEQLVQDDKRLLDQVVKGNNQFAFDLYGRLRSRRGNVFVSPYSVSSALSMTYAGARGQTERQMAKTLHFLNQKQHHPTFSNLRRSLNRDGRLRNYELHVVNSLWAQMGLGMLEGFLNQTNECYGAKLREVDFERNPNAVRQVINRWVED